MKQDHRHWIDGTVVARHVRTLGAGVQPGDR